MLSPVEQIKASLKIADLVGEFFSVSGRGRVLTTTEHDSLKIFTDTNSWYWYSLGVGGDLLDWWQHMKRCDFGTALEDLAAKANVELRPLSAEERSRVIEERAERDQRRCIWEMAAEHYHGLLLAYPAGKDYCASRGWTDETIVRERIGYVPGSTDKPLLSVGELPSLFKKLQAAGLHDHPLAKAVLSIPQGHIVYVHRNRGMVEYLSARSVAGKRHYNLPADLAGERQAYRAEPDKNRRGVRVLVEGQADAISLAQMGIEAVAACGVELGDLRIEEISHVAFDNDGPGQAKVLEVALALGPFVRCVKWPNQLPAKTDGNGYVDVKDANDLLKSRVDSGDVAELLESAPTALRALATKAGKEKDKDVRKALINRFFALYEGLDRMDQTDMKPDLSKVLCDGLSQFQRLWNAYKEENQREEQAVSEHHVVSPGGFVGGYLFEQCINRLPTGEMSAYYWVRSPDGKFEKKPSVTIGNTAYWPVDPREEELIAGGDVLFAEDRVESGSELELLRDIRRFIHRWLDVPAYYENIASYYVLLTWFYDAGYKTLPYLRALGDYGSGKSRFIQTIGQLCFRPMLFGGGDSEATIYYTLELFKGTFLIDESDFKSSDEAALISKIINLGNNEHGSIKRLDPKPSGQGYKVKRYSVFGPKVFGAREGFGDQASDSRCLTHYTTKGLLRPDVPLELTDEFDDEIRLLRNRLLDFRLKNWKQVKIDPSDIDRTIMPRLAQITLALKSIIKDRTVLEELGRFIQLYNQSLVSDRQMTDPAIVVEALVRIRYPKPQLAQVAPDWSILNIASVAQEIQQDFDPDMKFTPKKAGGVLSKQLGLIRRGERDALGRATIAIDDIELEGLMNRYGISIPEWYKEGNS